MKTRTLTIAFVCFCIFCLHTGSVKASITVTQPEYHFNPDNLPGGYTKIEIQGKLNYNTGPDDIVAGVKDNSVYIHFDKGFGFVGISIYNESGNLIYHCVLDTAMQRTIIIPIPMTNTANGNCFVEFDNDTGFAEGKFEQH
ncbi:MAG: DUF3244 domain-containing protein [Bacteroidales bacterium]|nr:DUF3244 domain-containing protein [Bacteroidales bacterium]